MRINRSIISNQTESVPVVRTLTINGTTYDLTENRSWTVSGGGVTGSGTTNYLSKWTSGTALGNSLVFDNGTNVGIGTATPGYKLEVNGTGKFTSQLFIDASASAYLRGGDDAELWDINTANTLGVYGVQNSAIGAIKLGSGGPTLYGASTNLVIGNTTNRLRLTVSGLDSSSPTLGTASGTMLLCNSTSTNDYGMMFGISPTGSGWIQQQRVDASATAYALLLQPSGGNVLVGTTIDNTNTFQVNGTIYGKGLVSDVDGGVYSAIYAYNQVLTGSSTNALIQFDTTWNTTGNANAIDLNVTNTASGASSKLLNLRVDVNSVFSVSKNGEVQTSAPTGYTAKPWKLGDATVGTITPDYYIKVEIDGQIYSIPALLGTP